MNFLQQSQTYTRMFFLVLSSDHLTAATGKTPSVSISKNGAAFGAAAGTVSEVGSGWYKIALTTADTGTAGDLAFHVTATACDDTDFCDRVVPGPVHPNGVTLGANGIPVGAFVNDSITAAAIAADAIGSSELAATAAQEVADVLLDRADAIETGLTLRNALRLIASAVAGKLSGAATTTVTIRNAQADSKNRIVATVDVDGNRTAVTTDLS